MPRQEQSTKIDQNTVSRQKKQTYIVDGDGVGREASRDVVSNRHETRVEADLTAGRGECERAAGVSEA